MNPRQRRGVLFILTSILLVVVVVVGLVSYVASVRSQVGATVTVYHAASDLDGYTILTPDMLTPVEVPQRWVSSSTVRDLDDLVGMRLSVAVKEGTTLTSELLVTSSDLDADQREIALEVDATTGLAGRVEPGSYVDIYAVFADVPGLPKQVRVLVRQVRVVSVGGSVTRTDEEDFADSTTVVPVTLALEANDALAVTFAAAFADEVRLVGLPLGNTQDRSGESDDFDASDLGGVAVPEEGQ